MERTIKSAKNGKSIVECNEAELTRKKTGQPKNTITIQM